MHSAAAPEITPVQHASTSQAAPPATGEIRLAEHKVSPAPSWGTSYVIPPSRVEKAAEQVTIYLASGGQGGGHLSPMDAVAKELHDMPDVRLIYDQLPVHTFNRDNRDHLRYKLTNTRLGGKLANAWREMFMARPQYKTISTRVKDLTQNERIDYAVTNHRFIAAAMADALPHNVPMGVDIVDPGKPHQGWYNTRMTRILQRNRLDRLFATNPDGVRHARKHGVNKNNIQELGYPVRKAFERYAEVSKDDARAERGIPKDKIVVVMSAGNARNPGAFVDQVRGLLGHDRAGELHVIALTATNDKLAGELAALNKNATDNKNGATIEPLGMQNGEQMAQLMRAADFMAIQPGGGSLGECYAMGVVPIVWGEKSGIEHSNRKHVQRNGTGIVAFNPASVKNPTVDDATLFQNAIFNTTKEELDTMRTNQQKFKVVGAARAIANSIRDLARQNRGLAPLEGSAATTAGVPVTGETPATPFTGGGSDPTPTSPFSPDPERSSLGETYVPPVRREVPEEGRVEF